MWKTSDAYMTALYQANREWSVKVEVMYGGEVVTTLNVVADGRVDVDEVAVRRSLNIRMIDADGTLTPGSARDLLAPKGTEMRVYKGLKVSGAVEWVPLGVFEIVEPTISAHNPGTMISIKAFDRVQTIRERRFPVPYKIVGGTPTVDAIKTIITDRISNIPVRVTPTGNTTNEVVYDELGDAWDAINELSRADSLIAYFDPLGTAVIEPDSESDTGVTYSPGDGSVFVKHERVMKADQMYSGVIVKGNHPDMDPVRVVLWDTDPKSVTFYQGPFGKRPYGFTSPLISSTDQANTAAATLLARITKMRQEGTLTTIGHPGHEVGDVIEIVDPDSKTTGRWTIYGGSIPLRLGQVTWKVRSSLS